MKRITTRALETSEGASQEPIRDSSSVVARESKAENSSSDLDEITVLIAESGHAAKTLSRTQTGEVATKSYSAGSMFRVLTYGVSSIQELGARLDAIQNNRRCLVIRGKPLKTLVPGEPVRRLKANFVTPVRGRRWVMIDFDKIALPKGMGLHIDASQAIDHLVRQLPEEFHGVSYYWQLSSKAGFTREDVVSLHAWFWLDRPVSDAQLKAWGKAWNERVGLKLIDTALFNAVQQHYTSRPILIGLGDPFPVRSGLVMKSRGDVQLKLRKSAPKVRQQSGQARLTQTGAVAGRGFEAIVQEIGDHPDGDGFHTPIIRAIASYVATHEPQELNVDVLKATLREAILKADRSRHDDAYVERMASDEHLDPAIDSARKKFSPASRVVRKPRRIKEIAPHYSHRELDRETASAALKGSIKEFFARLKRLC